MALTHIVILVVALPGAIALLAVTATLPNAPGQIARGEDSVAGIPVQDLGETKRISLDFSLPTTTGDTFSLKTPFAGRLRVVCFLGCDCPVAKLYAPRLRTLAERFAADHVEFIAINSNPQDPLAKVAKFAGDHGLDDPSVRFPMLKDHDGQVAATIGATRTPEVFVIDSLGRVVYQGRIDDQYRPGVVTDSPGRDDLRIAIEEALAGKPVSVPSAPAAGCRIAKRRPIDPTATVSYAGEVSRILDRNCVECHRAGEIGPFALTDYDEIVGWADMIVEVIDQHRMPPWHANEEHARFVNSRRMPDEDKETIRRWVEAGAPFGDAGDLPPPAEFASGWQIGTPDVVIEMAPKPFTVPAEGTVEYQYFVIDPGFTSDTWVAAAEVIPGNRGVVHHAIAFIRPPDGVPIDGLGWLTAYVPGQRMPPAVSHRARKVPAGSKIVFQMHYTPSGKVENDLSKIGLIFADPASVTEELFTLVGINQGLEIPPQQADVSAEGHTDAFPAGGKLLAMSPHMHLRGKAFQVRQRTGDEERIVLEVPQYDFNWQHTYILAEPIDLDRVDSIDFTATFDNSGDNPFNPDPTDFVTWGDQTWEEMALVFYEVARPVGGLAGGERPGGQRVGRLRRETQPELAPSAEDRSDMTKSIGRCSYGLSAGSIATATV
jgi:peroxiredoxin